MVRTMTTCCGLLFSFVPLVVSCVTIVPVTLTSRVVVRGQTLQMLSIIVKRKGKRRMRSFGGGVIYSDIRFTSLEGRKSTVNEVAAEKFQVCPVSAKPSATVASSRTSKAFC